jgi:hypothetical protein
MLERQDSPVQTVCGSLSGPFNRELSLHFGNTDHNTAVLLVNGEKIIRGFFVEKFSGSSMGILNFSTYTQYPEDFFR